MGLLKVIILALIVGGAYKYWSLNNESVSGSNSEQFVPVVMPNETKSNHVMILAPTNCSRDEAIRAQELSDQLTKIGIPNKIISSVSFKFTKAQEQKMKRTANILNGKVPIVLFKGLGQENPSLEMVVATYYGSR